MTFRNGIEVKYDKQWIEIEKDLDELHKQFENNIKNDTKSEGKHAKSKVL
jgi:hypothetical protein